MTYTIGEIAKILGCKTSTLRFYDSKGLLPFVNRNESDIRVFEEADLNWLQFIVILKNAGMKIEDIQKFVKYYVQGDSTIQNRYQMFVEQKKTVEKQIKLMQHYLEIIKFKCWYYEIAAAHCTTAVPNSLKPEDMPEEMRALNEKYNLILRPSPLERNYTIDPMEHAI